MTRERNVIGVGIGSHNQVETVVQSITTRDEKGDVNKKNGRRIHDAATYGGYQKECICSA